MICKVIDASMSLKKIIHMSSGFQQLTKWCKAVKFSRFIVRHKIKQLGNLSVLQYIPSGSGSFSSSTGVGSGAGAAAGSGGVSSSSSDDTVRKQGNKNYWKKLQY